MVLFSCFPFHYWYYIIPFILTFFTTKMSKMLCILHFWRLVLFSEFVKFLFNFIFTITTYIVLYVENVKNALCFTLLAPSFSFFEFVRFLFSFIFNITTYVIFISIFNLSLTYCF